jgi:hypothetical protein
MSKRWIHKYKPAAPASVQLLLASIAWSLVGIVLLAVGVHWSRDMAAGGLYIAAAVAAGLVKSRFVLDGTARKASARITQRGDGKCIGGFFSYKSWLLVGVMAAVGRILRSGLLARSIVGIVYAAVGTALFYSSRVFWRSYARKKGAS